PGRKRHRPQPLTARTPWHDEGDSKTAPYLHAGHEFPKRCLGNPRQRFRPARAGRSKKGPKPLGQIKPHSANDVVSVPATMT
ncbi:hypothetical protein LZC08_09925, partial [Campylobacter coli]